MINNLVKDIELKAELRFTEFWTPSPEHSTWSQLYLNLVQQMHCDELRRWKLQESYLVASTEPVAPWKGEIQKHLGAEIRPWDLIRTYQLSHHSQGQKPSTWLWPWPKKFPGPPSAAESCTQHHPTRAFFRSRHRQKSPSEDRTWKRRICLMIKWSGTQWPVA